MAGEPFIGEIRLFGFSYAPRGWSTAQGQIVNISQNQALFALYGTTYGGNGSQTFGLPNLSGRSAVGQGTLAGGSGYTMGQTAGAQSVTLGNANMPSHAHNFSGTLPASDSKAGDNTPTAGGFLGRANDTSGSSTPQVYVPAGTSANVAMAGISGLTSPVGGNQPFSVQSPVLGLNYSVALTGIYPSRN